MPPETLNAHLPDGPLPEPGFRDGKLFVDVGENRQAIAAWPELHAWEKGPAESTWRRCENPDLDLGWMTDSIDAYADGTWGQLPLFYDAEAHQAYVEAYDFYLRMVPEPVLNWASSYPESYWRILSAFARMGPAAEQLVRNGQFALLFMLSHLDIFDSTSPPNDWSRAKRLALGSQNEVLSALGFEPSELIGDLLNRVPAGSCSRRNLRWLRAMFRRLELRDRLALIPRINIAVMAILRNDPLWRACSVEFIREVGEASFNDVVSLSAWDLIEVLDFDETRGYSRQPIRSLAELDLIRHKLLNLADGQEPVDSK
jgi:hypothetical protein